ncbi:putative Copper resistance protein, copC family [Bradyrhizobium sp. ORS 375]|uniref:copper resistance CopC family protein n=1 Tax=Bradyrhizobium sp. (strain ORS 375) TaxID=566679 RepID=UPI0002406A03|nr:copper resistance CopC family protein [Bradyrhizobium sp. ORS 375]CCD95322.1 putative Copper resistance protein, copC family [Bradyrhizobium sp. ORS 375]
MPSALRLRLLLSLAVLAAPAAASAHAVIVSSQPASGATIDRDAVAIRLRFNSRIDHARSRLKLKAPDGAEQALAPAADTAADEIGAQARALSPGAWHLQWQVLSVDGHITRGDIPFNVR